MESYGERLQYSLFICDLSRTELIHARAEVEAKMKLSEDSVVIVDLGDVDTGRFTFIGRRRPLPTHGVRIV
ncbi:CRISPR-associated endonuclease Cas2 [Actinoplanes awajinensis]